MRKTTLTAFLVLAILATPAMAEVVNGTGTLYAEGTGYAVLHGTGWFWLEGSGKMVIIGKDVKVATRGNGVVKKVNEYVTVYEGSGVAVAKGKDMTVYIKASGKLFASGTGWAVLKGTGSFETWRWVVLPPRPAPLEVEE